MKLLSWMFGLFAVIGVGALIGAGVVLNSTYQFLDWASYSDGVVTELVRNRSNQGSGRGSYAPVVEFKTESGETIEFVSTTSSNPPSFRKGERVEVVYDPWSPQDAKINSFFSLWGTPLILGFLGFVFSFFGLGWFTYNYVQSRMKKRLLSSGIPVQAKIIRSEVNSRIKVNGRRPYRLKAQWLDAKTSKMYTFYSENYWYYLSQFADREEVTVYIDKDNPKKYVMDTSFLPEAAN